MFVCCRAEHVLESPLDSQDHSFEPLQRFYSNKPIYRYTNNYFYKLNLRRCLRCSRAHWLPVSLYLLIYHILFV